MKRAAEIFGRFKKPFALSLREKECFYAIAGCVPFFMSEHSKFYDFCRPALLCVTLAYAIKVQRPTTEFPQYLLAARAADASAARHRHLLPIFPPTLRTTHDVYGWCSRCCHAASFGPKNTKNYASTLQQLTVKGPFRRWTTGDDWQRNVDYRD